MTNCFYDTSLPQDDSKPGINASWQSITEMRTDIFESRIAEKCVWFDLSGNSLQYDSYAKEENVLGTVKSRKHTPGQVPDMWCSFQVTCSLHRHALTHRHTLSQRDIVHRQAHIH